MVPSGSRGALQLKEIEGASTKELDVQERRIFADLVWRPPPTVF